MATYNDPTVVSIHPDSRSQLGVVGVAFIAVGLLSLASVGYFLVEKKMVDDKTANLQKQMASDTASRASLSQTADDLTRFNSAAKGLHQVFDKQQLWETVLANLEPRLYTRMKVDSLQIADDGTFTLSGSTADDVQYAKLYASLTDETAQKYFGTVKPVSVAKVAATAPATDKTPSLAPPSRVTFSFQGKLNMDNLQGGKK